MKGRRIPVTDSRIDPSTLVTEPGDYYGPVLGWSDDKPAVFFLLPIIDDKSLPSQARSIHHVQSPPHVFTEESDGTLTITESIGAGRPHYWHGYLTKGEWKEI